MKRRYYYLLSLIFLGGLLALDVALLIRPARLRARIDAELRDRLKVAFRHGQLGFDSGLQIRLPQVVLYRGTTHEDPVVSCEEIVVGLDWLQLLQGEVLVRTVTARAPVVHLRWDDKGELDVPSVLRSRGTRSPTQVAPRVLIEDMTVVFERAPQFDHEGPLSLRDIDIELTPQRSNVFGYGFQGTIADPVFGHFELAGEFGDAQFRGQLRRDGFKLEEGWVSRLKPALRQVLSKVTMSGEADLVLDVSARDFLESVDISGGATLHDVGLSYSPWPQGLEHVQGHLRYHRGRIASDDLELRIWGSAVGLESVTVDLGGEHPVIRTIGEARRLDLSRRLADQLAFFPAPFPEVGGVLRAIGAEGPIDARFELSYAEPFDRLMVDVLVRFREASLCYHGFGGADGYPYPIENVVGSLHIGNDELEFFDVRPNTRSPDIAASGRVSYGRLPFSYELEFAGREIPLDERVRSSLPPDVRRTYDGYQPEGQFDFELKIAHPADRVGAPDVSFAVDLQGASARPAGFPYRLDDLRGHLVFGEKDGTRVEAVTGRHGDTRVELDGTVDLDPDEEHPFYALTLGAQGLVIDSELLSALDAAYPEISSAVRGFNLEGAVDLRCTLDSRPAPDSRERYEIGLAGLSFYSEDYPDLRGTDLVGTLVVENGRLTIESARMRMAGNDFTAAGFIEVQGPNYHDVTLTAERFMIDAATLELVGGVVDTVKALDQALDVRGPARLELQLKKTHLGSLMSTQFDALGLDVTCADPPARFVDVHGSLQVIDGDVTLKAWTGRFPYGQGDLTVSIDGGHIGAGPNGRTVTLARIGLADLRVDDPAVRRLLPEAYQRSFDELGIAGRLDVDFGTLTAQGGVVATTGTITSPGLRMNPGIPIVMRSGRLEVDDLRYDDDGLRLVGRLADAALTVFKFDAEDVSARVEADPEGLAIVSLDGRALGGAVNPADPTRPESPWAEERDRRPQGSYFTMKFDEERPFRAGLSFEKWDLSRFVNDLGGDPKLLEGRATGWAALHGRFGDLDSFRGRGVARLSGRRLYELPFIAVVLEFLNLDFLSVPQGQAQSGLIEVDVADRRVNVTQARFEGPGVHLDGKGHIGFDGICQIDFDPELIRWLDQIPVVSEIFGIGSGLFVSKVRVHGPIEKPDATTENLVTEIFTPQEDSGRRLKIRPTRTKRDEEEKRKQQRP